MIKKKHLKFLIHNANIPKKVCNHVLGKDHSHTHRKIVGFVCIAIGILIGKTFFVHVGQPAIEYCAELIGFSLHGVGLTPFIES